MVQRQILELDLPELFVSKLLCVLLAFRLVTVFDLLTEPQYLVIE